MKRNKKREQDILRGCDYTPTTDRYPQWPPDFLGKYSVRKGRNGYYCDDTMPWICLSKDKQEIADFKQLCKTFNKRVKAYTKMEFNKEKKMYEVSAIEEIHIGFNSMKSNTHPCVGDVDTIDAFRVLYADFIRNKKDALLMKKYFSMAIRKHNPLIAINTTPGGCKIMYASRGIYKERFDKFRNKRLKKVYEISKQVEMYFDSEIRWNVPRENPVHISEFDMDIPEAPYGGCSNYKYHLANNYTHHDLYDWLEAGKTEEVYKKSFHIKEIVEELKDDLKQEFKGIHCITLSSFCGLFGSIMVTGIKNKEG